MAAYPFELQLGLQSLGAFVVAPFILIHLFRWQETCQSNKENRFEVKFHQKTGSRPYISHVHALKEARKGEELTLFDLFKECHNGKKTGFSEPVKKADM